MEVICNLYKASGKWYGQHTFFHYSFMDQPTNEVILMECERGYTNPQDFIIHVQHGQFSKLIIPDTQDQIQQ